MASDVMKDPIDTTKKTGIRDMIKIIRGNISENMKIFADADAYSIDSMAAVSLAKKAMASKP